MNGPHSTQLHEAQMRLLRRFIAPFLPPQDKFHRNLANEINYVTTTLNRVLLHHFGFRVNKEMVTEALQDNKCILFTKNDQANNRKYQRRIVPSEQNFLGTLFSTEKTDVQETVYVHADIDAGTVRTLRLTTIPIPENTAPDKRLQVKELLHRLKEWKKIEISPENPV